MTKLGLSCAMALLLTLFLTPLTRLVAVRRGWVARPVEDRWCRRVVARLGGIAMFVSFVASVFWWVPMERVVIVLLGGVTLVFGVGLVDDIRRMAPYTKLIIQLLIGSLVVFCGVRISVVRWEWMAIPLSVLWLVLVMNAFNLLDNMDGLAAGIGAIAAGFCIVHAVLAKQETVALLAAIVCGVCLGFLRYNFPPAKIFMGDSGSHVLGLSLAAMVLMGSWRHSTQLLSVLTVPALVLAVPIFDTCFVTVQRLLHRQHPFLGGRDHVSHRLVVLGLSTRQTVTALYAISASLGLLSVLSVRLKPLPIVALWLCALTGLVLFGLYLTKVKVYRLEPQLSSGRSVEVARPSTRIETMLFHKRRLLEIFVDFCLISSVYVFAYLLRFEGVLTADLHQLIVKSFPVILVIKLACFALYGLYQGLWRYLGLSDILTIFKAVTVGSVVSSLILLYLWRFEGFSRAVLIVDWMLTFLAVGGARVAERLIDEWINTLTHQQGHTVLIIGAGDTGAQVLQSLKYYDKRKRRVIGFLDDDPNKQGNRLLGAPVWGGREQLADVLGTCQVREVLVAITDPPGELLQHVQACCEPHGVTWKVMTAGVTAAV